MMTAEQAQLMVLNAVYPDGREDCEDCQELRGLCWECEGLLLEPPC